MSRVTRVTVDRSCAICERTLLMGERAIRFSPNGGADYVDVCPLCAETAMEYGWVREGAPTSPTVPVERKRRGQSWLQTLLGSRPRAVEETVAWDISWYQYRVSPDSDNPVRLEGRGHDPAELEGAFTGWNAHMSEDGRIVPDIARL